MSTTSTITKMFAELDETTRRFVVFLAAGVLLAIIGFAAFQQYLARLDKQRISREKALAELLVLRVRHQEALAESSRIKNRLMLVTAEDSPAALIEQIGIAARSGIQVKALPRQEQQGLLEDSAEVTISGLTSNDLVNLLYRLEQHPKPIVVKNILARTRFNDPAKLDLTTTVALYRQGALQVRQ